ncbi:MAG: hypothetical protein LKF01_02340 [Lactobacillus sp.]|jgi:hypothetical protein|nr:hypothetical protein [Lactobacillus sp.]MCH3905514.1 hypothetical protein [Lactobacillus sp.]MCH3990918.1 hypothetical protein [Lactobacillus sp.]MCH4068366.1 hypothetical protein [Lactobacillus sp.]MCI1304379.1 hypothetical protein [Lactobacillus sp.]
MTLFLTLVSGIAWTIVYIECIRLGFKQRTYSMPLFALALNIAWEGIYSIVDLHNFSAQTVVNLVWFIFDLVIACTYFKFGRKEFSSNSQRFFLPISIIVFATCLLIQLGFYWQFGLHYGSRYSAFLQNLVMSIMFIAMLFKRDNKKGQSLTIAVAKWIGTLAPTILMGILQEVNVYVIVCGGLCSVFDILYIVLLAKWSKIAKPK